MKIDINQVHTTTYHYTKSVLEFFYDWYIASISERHSTRQPHIYFLSQIKSCCMNLIYVNFHVPTCTSRGDDNWPLLRGHPQNDQT